MNETAEAAAAAAGAAAAENGAVWSVAVIGNPNTGKSTLFNALTGLRQHVGNYPGVTVERKTGLAQLDANTAVELIDLPGTYSLAARSPDEMIAVDVLVHQQPGVPPVDAILAIADASNPERNFYLISQLCELGLPVLVALNMLDVAESKGLQVDAAAISRALGAPVVGICANKGQGLAELKAALRNLLREKRPPTGPLPDFPEALRAEVDAVLAEVHSQPEKLKREVSRTEAFRALVDKGGHAERRLAAALGAEFLASLEAHRKKASRAPLQAEEVRIRYAWVKRLLASAVRRPARPPATRSDAIDKVVTHWATGTLVFAVVMYVVFQAIFSWATPLMDFILSGFHALGAVVGAHLPPGALRSLLCDGVLAGAGTVLAFLPQICILFLFIAILEDCGYMARAAFLMDRLFSHVGLSGKSFIPMLSSFACAVPGVMATRTIENWRDRLTTILVSPLMSCSARLPVYAIMISTFIPEHYFVNGWVGLRTLVLLAMYAVGIVVAVPVAWLLKKTLLKGETPPFLIELPSYKMPSWRTVALRIYDRAKAFAIRAGTIILAVSVIVWALSYFPHPPGSDPQFAAQRRALAGQDSADGLAKLDREEAGAALRQSYFARMGHGVETVFRPLGWDWRISMAALASFPAREVIVASLGTIFNLGGGAGGQEAAGLRDALRQATWENSARPLFTIPVALSIMVFFALCSQCAATLATIKRETNSWRWPIFAFSYMTLLAYLAALVTYQASTALGWG